MQKVWLHAAMSITSMVVMALVNSVDGQGTIRRSIAA